MNYRAFERAGLRLCSYSTHHASASQAKPLIRKNNELN
jgi:hypothetical protein